MLMKVADGRAGCCGSVIEVDDEQLAAEYAAKKWAFPIADAKPEPEPVKETKPAPKPTSRKKK